ncbi:MAG: hypothetical protein RR087_11340, partial [Oscillospiraceae bacterium]
LCWIIIILPPCYSALNAVFIVAAQILCAVPWGMPSLHGVCALWRVSANLCERSRATAPTERGQNRRQCRVGAEPPSTQWVCNGKFWGQAMHQGYLKSTLLAHV